jgi:CheY-like chemotaxis protein
MSTVFVVDDDQDIRDLITFVLRRAGHDVESFEDPRAALARAESSGFDLAVLDWSMPHMDGGELCARLRQLPALATVPILILTAHADSATRERASEVGATGFMSKPFALTELTDIVATMLAAV